MLSETSERINKKVHPKTSNLAIQPLKESEHIQLKELKLSLRDLFLCHLQLYRGDRAGF